MTALAANRPLKEKPIKRLRYNLPIGIHAYQNGAACMAVAAGVTAAGVAFAAGQIVPGFASPSLVRIGVFAEEKDNSAGTAVTPVNVDLDQEIIGRWFSNDATTPVVAGGLLQDCYMLDDQTVSGNPAGRSVAGRVWQLDGLLGVLVQANFKLIEEGDYAFVHQARAVITSIAAYTAASPAAGTLTANAVGAIGAQDGVTLVAGDVVILPTDKAATAKDAGPYIVVNPGSGAAKFVLTRPAWFATGSTQQTGTMLTVGGEGTVYGGSEWKSIIAATTFVVDTTDGVFYPRIQTVTTAAMVAGVSAANSTLYVSPNAQFSPLPVTPGGAQGILRMSTATTGKPTVSSLVVTSSSNTDTSTVKIQVVNF